MAVQIADGTLATGGAIIETSGGVKYAIFIGKDAESVLRLEVWKDIDGIPSLEDYDYPADIFGGGLLKYCDAALRSDGDIAIVAVCSPEQTRDVSYCVFDTSAGTLGAWSEAAAYTDGAPTNPGCSITINSNDYPHILYVDDVKTKGTNYDQIYHAWNDGSWNTEIVCSNTQLNYRYPKISSCPNDDLEAVYYNGTNGILCYQRKNASWPGESTWTQGAVAFGILVTTGDTVYRYGSEIPGSAPFDIYEDEVDAGYDCVDDHPWFLSIALSNGTRYIFYIDTDNDVHLISNSGSGWIDEGALQEGTFTAIIAEWAYLNEHQSGEINYLFDDGTYVYYDAFSLGAAPTNITPSAVAITSAIPTPTLLLGTKTVVPSPVATPLIIPVPTLSLSYPLAPDAVGITASVAAPSLSLTLTLVPSPVATNIDIPQPTVVIDQIIMPDAVEIQFAAVTPDVALLLTLTSSAVQVSNALVAPTLVLSLGLMPSTVQSTISIAAPTIGLSLTLTPSAIQVIADIPAPTIFFGQYLTPSPVEVQMIVAAPTIGLSLTLTPSAVQIVVNIPAPMVVLGQYLSPSPVEAQIQIPLPTLVFSINLTPSPISITAAIAIPSISLIKTVTPNALAVSMVAIAPTLVLGTKTLTPAAVMISSIVVAPSLALVLSINPSPITASMAVSAVALDLNYPLSPNAVALFVGIASPSLILPVFLSPDAVAMIVAIVSPSLVLQALPMIPFVLSEMAETFRLEEMAETFRLEEMAETFRLEEL